MLYENIFNIYTVTYFVKSVQIYDELIESYDSYRASWGIYPLYKVTSDKKEKWEDLHKKYTDFNKHMNDNHLENEQYDLE